MGEDRSGQTMWEFYSTQSQASFSPEHGEYPPYNQLSFWGGLIETMADLNQPYYAFFGTRNNRSALSNSLWLTQPRIVVTVFLETQSVNPHTGVFEFGLEPAYDQILAEMEGLSRREQADFRMFYLTRDEIAQLGDIVIEPYFLQTSSSLGR